MRRKRFRNFGTLNDRETIKARQSLDFKSWVENVKFNQEAASIRLKKDEKEEIIL